MLARLERDCLSQKKLNCAQKYFTTILSRDFGQWFEFSEYHVKLFMGSFCISYIVSEKQKKMLTIKKRPRLEIYLMNNYKRFGLFWSKIMFYFCKLGPFREMKNMFWPTKLSNKGVTVLQMIFMAFSIK